LAHSVQWRPASRIEETYHSVSRDGLGVDLINSIAAVDNNARL